MKLVQKILSHGLLIAFVVAAFFIVTNRAELFPRWFAKSQTATGKAASEQTAAPVAPPAHRVTRPLPEKTLIKKEGATVQPVAPAGAESGNAETAPTPTTQATVETRADDSSASAPVTQAPAAVEAVPPAAETLAPAAETSNAADAASSAAEPAAPAVAAPPPAVTAPTSAPSGVVTESAEAGAVSAWQQRDDGAAPGASTYRPLGNTGPADDQPATADAPVPAPVNQGSTPAAATPAPVETSVPTASSPQSTDATAAGATVTSQAGSGNEQLEQQLTAVRALYWRRDLRGAAAGYQSLGQTYPDNADVWGEIGNFYFSVRQIDAATGAYSRAIELLARQGDPLRARQLLAVLYRMDAAAARELEKRLQQSGG